MKVQLISDTHGTALSSFLKPKAKTLILAGDIGANIQSLLWDLEYAQANWENVIYVPGNHCFYQLGSTIQAAKDRLIELTAHLRVQCMIEPGILVIGKQRFVCATMWTQTYDKLVEQLIYDYRFFTMEDLNEEHLKQKAFLFKNVMEDDMVITHHTPSLELQNARFPVDTISTCFNVQMDMPYSPKIWAFGHTHYNYDKVIGKTRYVSNQYGYKNELMNEGTECFKL